MSMMQRLSSLQSLAGQYKGVLLDQFGVLHDGRRPYPGSVEAVRRLYELQIPIYLLSNSSQRSEAAYGRLETMGFQRTWIKEIVTSGEVTHQHLLNRRGQFWEKLGRRCLHFTWSTRGKIQLQELGLQVVADVSQADFILAHGTDALGLSDGTGVVAQSYAELAAKLEEAAALPAPPPMIVANADFVTVDGTALRKMPGSLGLLYKEMGGDVTWMGKPGNLIYEHILHLSHSLPAELVAIGDSMEHDIKGAAAMGIDTVFVAGGIHASDVLLNGTVCLTALQRLCTQYSAQPTFYIDFFNNEKL